MSQPSPSVLANPSRMAYAILRTVPTIKDAHLWVHSEQRNHANNQRAAMEHFSKRVDDLASIQSENETNLKLKPVLKKREEIWKYWGERIESIQNWIEAAYGPFSELEKAHTLKSDTVEHGLLAVLQTGLLKQERVHGNFSGTPEEMAGPILDSVNSCMLEARKWQLEVLGGWFIRMRIKIEQLGGSVDAEEERDFSRIGRV